MWTLNRLAFLFEKLRQDLVGLHVAGWPERGNYDQILESLKRNVRILAFFFFFLRALLNLSKCQFTQL